MNKRNPMLQQVILETVSNQIDSNDPPETKTTLNRLMDSGYDYNESLKLIGTAVAYELFYIMKHQQEFNEERYIEHLANLPEMPEEE